MPRFHSVRINIVFWTAVAIVFFGLGMPIWAQALEQTTSLPSPAPLSADLPILPVDDPAKNYIGMNTWFLNDWDGSFAFADAMKHARPWQDASNWNDPVAGIDALGWPTADASTVVFTGTPAQVNGTYRLVFTGQADVSILWYQGAIANKVYDTASNTTTANVTINSNGTPPTGGLVFRNTRRTAASAINTGFTNVRLYRPGYPADGSVIFTSDFLRALGKTSVVRMMDWMSINQNLVQHWADRRTPLHMATRAAPYTGPGGTVWNDSVKGVAIEHQIQLCNTLGADCWINIPVVADDDYVQKLALALRYGTDGTNPYTSDQDNPVYPPLAPGLRVYLEYANEIWNSAGGFYCFGVIKDIVEHLPAGHEVLTPAGGNVWLHMWRYAAYRAANISDIFRSVYGDASMMNRVRPVVMTQQGNGQTTLSEALMWLDAYGKRQLPARAVGSYIYGAGGSAYYNVNNAPIPVAEQGNADLFYAPGNYPAAKNVKAMGIDAIWAANFGVKRIAYEGGQSLDNYSKANAQTINADPRMQDMVVKTHDAWSSQGGDLLMYYTLRGPAAWEFTPDITTTDTPKFKGIAQLQAQPRAAVSLGQPLPGVIVATEQIAHRIRTGYDYVTTCDSLPCIGGNAAGTWIALPGHTGSAFSGHITINGIARLATTLKVVVNGVDKGKVTMGPGNHLANSTSLHALIPAGLVVIRLEVVTGGLDLRSITVNRLGPPSGVPTIKSVDLTSILMLLWE